jgi:hypothetical protein
MDSLFLPVRRKKDSPLSSLDPVIAMEFPGKWANIFCQKGVIGILKPY